MKKAAIRELYKQMRMEITGQQRAKFDDLMLIQFQQSGIEIPSLIMTYAPMLQMGEFDPQLITDYCYFKNPGQALFYPVVTNEKEMISVVVDDNTTFVPSKFGVNEPVDGLEMFPEEIDLVIVPLLAFDESGYRVGYGKGYYDRFLKKCREDVVKVGFSYFEPVKSINDVNAFDVKLDYCITPHQIYCFNEQLNR